MCLFLSLSLSLGYVNFKLPGREREREEGMVVRQWSWRELEVFWQLQRKETSFSRNIKNLHYNYMYS